MLTVRMRIIIACVLIIALAFIINTIRRKRIDVKYALPWFAMILALALFDGFPALLNMIAGILGIYSSVNMLVFLGFIFALMIIFNMTIVIYNVSLRVRKLGQELAIMQNKLDSIEDNVKKD